MVATAAKRRTKPKDIHLSMADLAERESVSLATVTRWNRLGTGPEYMRIGDPVRGTVRYCLADVLAWEKECIVGAAGRDETDARAS